jgi:hypothetical protein
MDMKVMGYIGDDRFKLLQAGYVASANCKSSTTPMLDIHRHPVDSQPNARLLPVEEDRITFRLKEAVHAKLRERLVGSDLGSDEEYLDNDGSVEDDL